ncbi:MAG: gamma-glutamyl-gamma-aminobutyrate hydrolase family protein, partial [Bacteroidales bacterium]
MLLSENIEALFAETERCVAVANCRRTPIIGISTNQKEDTSRVANAYVRSIVNAGGIPLLIPECEDFSSLSEILERIDGLLLTGGGDISPELLGEKP